MNNEEIISLYNSLVEEFGDKLPDPEQEPIRFAYYVRLYKFIKQLP